MDLDRATGAPDFLRSIIDDDLKSKRRSRVVVRFPPEPNGYLHIGHAKSISLNFGLAAEYGGVCHLRFDDTNPETEDLKYVQAIKRDLKWLGADWGDKEFYASDYFEQLYDWAVDLITKGKAYVDDLSEEDIRLYRGTVKEPGRVSPFRRRSPEENLDLFARMRAGEFPDGTRVLRARIDMAHPNMKMRDPLMYRIRHATHYRRGDDWRIYPFYDWAHGQSDAIECITHSICTLEFTVNRPLYDWYLDALEISPRPYQYEFARLNLGYTITSKRKLLALVSGRLVDGWDDPRMPTLAGARRRGVPPMAIRNFCNGIGTTKVDSIHDPDLLDHHIRSYLNHQAPRVMCVLRPLKVTLTNYPAEQTQMLQAQYWPHDIPREGSRAVPFSRSLLIERDDFAEDPPRGFRRLSPGVAVRLRHACVIRCDQAIKNASGEVIELLCTWFPGGEDGHAIPKARGTIHWVDAHASLPAEVRLYDRLFTEESPADDFMERFNSASKVVLAHSRIEPSTASDPPQTRYQFTRLGYFWRDQENATPEKLVFHRIVPLRDSWRKPVTPLTVVAPKDAEPSEESFREPPLHSNERAWLARSGLPSGDGRILLSAPGAVIFWESAAKVADGKSVAKWMINQLLPARKREPLSAMLFGPEEFGQLVAMVDRGGVATHLAREILTEMLVSGGDPETLAATMQAAAMDDQDALGHIIDELLRRFPDKVRAFRHGKSGLLGFFVGLVMRASDGKAPPKLVRAMVEKKLRNSP